MVLGGQDRTLAPGMHKCITILSTTCVSTDVGEKLKRGILCVILLCTRWAMGWMFALGMTTGTLLVLWLSILVQGSFMMQQARLNEYIVNNSWCMPAAVSRDILTMNCYMPDYSPNANVPDCAVWCLTGNGQYASIHASGHRVPSEFISQ